jgi:hypothetical protein
LKYDLDTENMHNRSRSLWRGAICDGRILDEKGNEAFTARPGGL